MVMTMSTKSVYQFRIDTKEKEEVFAILKDLGFTPAQAIKLFLRQVKKTRSIPFEISAQQGRFIEPDATNRKQAFENFMKLTQERAENPTEALKNLTLAELNQMIDEEREAVHQEQLKSQNA